MLKDGNTIASGHVDGTVCLWDVRQGRSGATQPALESRDHTQVGADHKAFVDLLAPHGGGWEGGNVQGGARRLGRSGALPPCLPLRGRTQVVVAETASAALSCRALLIMTWLQVPRALGLFKKINELVVASDVAMKSARMHSWLGPASRQASLQPHAPGNQHEAAPVFM